MDHSYSPNRTMYIEEEMVNNIHTLHSLKDVITQCIPDVIKIKCEVGKIDFPLHTRTLIIDYDISTTNDALHLRRILVQSHTNTVIINGNRNIIQYIQENTIEYGSGLFGAILRNPHVKYFIIRDLHSKWGSIRQLKHILHKEEKRYNHNMITPTQRKSIHIY